MEIIGVIVIGVLAILLIAGALYILLWIMGVTLGDASSAASQSNSKDGLTGSSGMNEGDFHSGPGGYSPNTAYPDTFYGSGGSSSNGNDFGNDDFGGHNEGDFNR